MQIHAVTWMLGVFFFWGGGHTLINLAVECSRIFAAVKEIMSHRIHEQTVNLSSGLPALNE